MSIGSLIEWSSFPFLKERSGRNSLGSGSFRSSFNIALRNKVVKYSILRRGTISPLVGDHNRVCGDMIAVVKIVAGQVVRNTLTK